MAAWIDSTSLQGHRDAQGYATRLEKVGKNLRTPKVKKLGHDNEVGEIQCRM